MDGRPVVGINVGLIEELEAELCQVSCDRCDQLIGDERDDGEDAERAQHHEQLKAAVGDGGVAAREQEAANRRVLLRRNRRGPGSGGSKRLRLRLRLRDANLRHGGVHSDQATGEFECEVTRLQNQAHTGGNCVESWSRRCGMVSKLVLLRTDERSTGRIAYARSDGTGTLRRIPIRKSMY